MEPLTVPSADIITQQPKIHFQTEGVPPPSPLYLGQEDDLFMRVAIATIATGFQVVFAVRTLFPGGKVKVHKFPVLVSGTSVTVRRNLGECFILSVTAQLTGGATAGRGQVFCQASVVRGISGSEDHFWTLLSDYVTTNCRPTWPNTILKSPLDGSGFLRSITGTVPGAGAEILETVPTGARWRLIALRVALTTSVAVANRLPTFFLDDGALSYFMAGGYQSQAASLTATYTACKLAISAAPLSGGVIISLPPDLFLLAAHRIRSSTVSLQAADQYTAPQYLVEEWVEF